MGRGRVRAALLALLCERSMHGYEMISELAERTADTWRPSPGSIYPTLQMLQDEGLVEGRVEAGRRLFTLTDDGRRAAPTPDGPRPWEQAGCGRCAHPDPCDTDLRDAAVHLLLAVDQLLDAGTSEQKVRVLPHLTAARQAIYLALADAVPPATGPPPDTGPPG
jgi:DNA-binding transcriptional ArsR family regulator